MHQAQVTHRRGGRPGLGPGWCVPGQPRHTCHTSPGCPGSRVHRGAAHPSGRSSARPAGGGRHGTWSTGRVLPLHGLYAQLSGGHSLVAEGTDVYGGLSLREADRLFGVVGSSSSSAGLRWLGRGCSGGPPPGPVAGVGVGEGQVQLLQVWNEWCPHHGGGLFIRRGQVHWRGWRQRWEEVQVWKCIINVQGREGSEHPPLESWGGTAGPGAAALPGGIQERSFPPKPASGAFMGAGDSQGWPGWAS